MEKTCKRCKGDLRDSTRKHCYNCISAFLAKRVKTWARAIKTRIDSTFLLT